MNRQRGAAGSGRSQFRWGRTFAAAGVIVVALIIVSAGLAVWYARQQTFEQRQRGMTNLAIALGEQTARYVQLVDLTMVDVMSWIADSKIRTHLAFRDRVRSPEADHLLAKHLTNLPQTEAIVLIGADGEVLNSSKEGFASDPPVSGRDYYEYLRQHDDPAIFIGAPDRNRTTNNWNLSFARRINSPDGTFLGIVLGLMDATYLANFYQSVGKHLGEEVTLVRRDGAVLVRYPEPANTVGRHIPSASPWYARVADGGGFYRSPGYFTGTASIVVVHPVRDYPLVVDVVLAESVILAPWRSQVVYIATVALVVALGFVALIWVIGGQFRRQYEQNVKLSEAAAALRASERQLRTYAEMAADWFWEQDADNRFRWDSNIPLTSRPTDVGKTRWELADHAMSQDRWDIHIADLTARRAFRDFRWERIGTDGRRRYMCTSGDPMFDEHGTFLGYHGTGREVTAEVEAAEQLRLAKDQAEAANLANSELVTAVRFANDAIVGLAPDGLVRTWNPAAERLYAMLAHGIIGRNINVLWPPEQEAAISAALREVASGKLVNNLETVGRQPDGHVTYISVSAAPVTASDGVVTGLIVTARDISDRKNAEAAARRSQEQIASVFRDASVGLNQTDMMSRYSLVNDRYCAIVGRTRHELMSLTARDISHPDDNAAIAPLIQRLRTEGTAFVIEKRYIRPDGSHIWVRNSMSPARDHDGNINGTVAVVEDITERKEAEDRLRHLAYHDPLTGLANRVLMNVNLSQALARAGRSGTSVAVLALDLDRFKSINDTFGHDAGDALLSQAADRLRNAVRTSDTVARIGGDEIIVIQDDLTQPIGATELARRIVGLLAEPFDLSGQPATVGVSVGIALYPNDGTTSIELLQNADAALYQAKREGRGRFRFFEAATDAILGKRGTLEHDLREAIAENELHLHFQPMLSCSTGTVLGFEALLRWDHPRLGEIEPIDIIVIAEESGLIVSLGLWIMERACSEAARWPASLRVAVNLSGAQFRDRGLADRLLDILHRTGLPASRLELEVTETLFITNIDHALSVLRTLKDEGARIALDDFGTGYSGLSYLRSFPFDKIKIDRSFVQTLTEDPSAVLMVRAILGMGHSLNLLVAAEGVETDRQLEILRQERCDEVQGFLLGAAMPPQNIDQYLRPRDVTSVEPGVDV